MSDDHSVNLNIPKYEMVLWFTQKPPVAQQWAMAHRLGTTDLSRAWKKAKKKK